MDHESYRYLVSNTYNNILFNKKILNNNTEKNYYFIRVNNVPCDMNIFELCYILSSYGEILNIQTTISKNKNKIISIIKFKYLNKTPAAIGLWLDLFNFKNVKLYYSKDKEMLDIDLIDNIISYEKSAKLIRPLKANMYEIEDNKTNNYELLKNLQMKIKKKQEKLSKLKKLEEELSEKIDNEYYENINKVESEKMNKEFEKTILQRIKEFL